MSDSSAVAQRVANWAISVTLVQRNWLFDRRIVEEGLTGADRADYGKQFIKQLSDELSGKYGKGFDQSSLYKFVRFYREFSSILNPASPKSRPLLSWRRDFA